MAHVAPDALTWLTEIFPDLDTRKTVTAKIGGRAGLQSMYENLIEVDKQSLEEAIIAKLNETGLLLSSPSSQ